MNDFLSDGIGELPRINPADTKKLLAKIKQTRKFCSDLFLDEQNFEDIHTGVNPGKGKNNLLETFDLSFIEKNPAFQEALVNILGANYEILLKKIVCGVPHSWLPAWVANRIQDKLVNNLGGYIKPEYRDITYFYGIDFHQDIIDFKGAECDFITVYIYLDDVTKDHSPLFVIPKSYTLGATKFPHNIIKSNDNNCIYNSETHSISSKIVCLTGPAGYASFWHACNLHGTQPMKSGIERLSLRYLIRKNPAVKDCLLDKANSLITGQLSLNITRDDVNAKGAALKSGNFVNKI